METKIDWKFIHENGEGGTKTEAYIPICTADSIANIANKACYGREKGSVIGKSGVTIAAGFDIGQRNTYDLDSLKLPAHLNSTLKPFLGKKKEDAKIALDEYERKYGSKPMITGTDAQLINQRVKEQTLRVLINNYNSESKVKFAQLDGNVQTALASFAFQYGANINKHQSDFVKKVWVSYTTQDLVKATQLLENAPAYNQRRRAEASLLRMVKK